MKLARIQIDRFGLWRNLDLALNPRGLSVVFGPNEAGKTTLLRFIRGVLYGFPLSELDTPDDRETVCGGSLDVQSGDRQCRITRQRTHGSLQELSLTGWDRAVPAMDGVREILSGTSRSIFQNVFAIGLQELQQLASLNGDEIAERVYGFSLGAEGQQILAAMQSTQNAQRLLFDADGKSGELFDLLHCRRSDDTEDRALAAQRDDYDHLLRERDRQEAAIRELQSRQNGMQSQLRGHRYLQRIWGPWQQVHDYRTQLDAVPNVVDFPADGVSRLRQLEADIESENRCRQTLRNEIGQLESRRESLQPDAALRNNLSALRRVVRERGRLRRIIKEREALQEEIQTLDRDFEEHCRRADSGWSETRTEAADCSPAAQFRLLHAARDFQAAGVRRGRCRRLLQNSTRSHRKLSSLIERKLLQAGSHSVDAAVVKQTQEIERLDNVRRLRCELEEAERQQAGLQTNNGRQTRPPVVPDWFRRVLWFFGIAGGLVAACGLISSFTMNAWSGLILSLAGFTGLGIAWGLNHHTKQSGHDESSRRQSSSQKHEQKRTTLRHALEQLMQDLGIVEFGTVDAEYLAAAHSRLAELQSLQGKKIQADRQRKRLSQLRHRFSGIRKNYGRARQEWCETLTRIGVPETLRVAEAFAQWQQVFELQQTIVKRNAARTQRDRRQQQYDRILKRIARTAEQLQETRPEEFNPITLLDRWNGQLQLFDESREECRDLAEQIGKRRREVAVYAGRLRELKHARTALLAQAGATDREDFEVRADSIRNRAELQELLELAEEELRETAAAEPELAVVEEDLLRHDADENGDCIRVLESELADIARDLENTHEEFGGVKHALKNLESDRQGSISRFRQAQHENELIESVQVWLANDAVRQSLLALTTRWERERQPAVMNAASRLMQQLTDNRYARVWSPLGRRRLCIDDARGRTWSLDELSGGTREQVFLAVRLALIEELSNHGVELPVVLDDVLVNFDQNRAAAAVKTLLRLADSGRQIIFLTCHAHIAEMFRTGNVSSLILPNPQREHRIAG